MCWVWGCEERYGERCGVVCNSIWNSREKCGIVYGISVLGDRER